MLDDDDPGWPRSLRLLVFVVPFVGMLNRRRLQRGGGDGLILLRQVFLSFSLALVMFGVVLALLYPSSPPPRDPPTTVVTGLLVFSGIVALLATRIERPLDCTDDAKLAGSYRSRFFLRIAFAESAALFGFVGFFLTYDWWPYPVGVAIAAAGFLRAAPTRGRLRRDQERLAEQGCFRPLVRALRVAMPPTS